MLALLSLTFPLQFQLLELKLMLKLKVSELQLHIRDI